MPYPDLVCEQAISPAARGFGSGLLMLRLAQSIGNQIFNPSDVLTACTSSDYPDLGRIRPTIEQWARHQILWGGDER